MKKWELEFDFGCTAVKVYAPTGVLVDMVEDVNDIDEKVNELGKKLNLSEDEKSDLYNSIGGLFWAFFNGKPAESNY